MGHRFVEGEGPRTTYSSSPNVEFRSVEDGPVSVKITFQAEPAPLGREAKFTELTFKSVFEYRWISSSFSYLLTNIDDHAFALIEIVDSEHVQMMLERNIYQSQPKGLRLGGVVKETEVRHFRIGFDRYGYIDILCLDLQVTHTSGISGQ